ncbi:hypothetical protein ACEQPO_02810 [Bacillus sp. SL00103]
MARLVSFLSMEMRAYGKSFTRWVWYHMAYCLAGAVVQKCIRSAQRRIILPMQSYP